MHRTATPLRRINSANGLPVSASVRSEAPPMIGESAPMRQLKHDLARLADSEVDVLIEGETGTGKELVAALLHAQSKRAHKPLVVIDCSALTATLAESELFGHERGAFTGAATSHTGLFEQAQGGSVFLDELGELPVALQPKLLRVLEQRVVRRVGGLAQVPIDVRVICATHRNLRADIGAGTFRQDLYYRVAQARLCVPPLRARAADLPQLIEHFLALEDSSFGLGDIPPSTMESLAQHAWPGNVRELRNVVRRLALRLDALSTDHQPIDEEPEIFADAQVDQAELTANSGQASSPHAVLLSLPKARQRTIQEFERTYLLELLSAAEHNVTRAAKLAGVSRQMIQRLLRKHDIRRAIAWE